MPGAMQGKSNPTRASAMRGPLNRNPLANVTDAELREALEA